MANIQVFLSTVSDEFKSYREALKHDLEGPRFAVKIQESFVAGGLGTLVKLDDYVRASDAVVHLVGDMTGSIPPAAMVGDLMALRPDFGQRLPSIGSLLASGQPLNLSYTQWEAYLAYYHCKPLYIAVPMPSAERDAGYRADRAQKASQVAHLARLEALGRHAEIKFASADRLVVGVLRSSLRDMLPPPAPGPAGPMQAFAGHAVAPPRRNFEPIVTYILDRHTHTQLFVQRVGRMLAEPVEGRRALAFIVPGPSAEGPEKFLEVLASRVRGSRWVKENFGRPVRFDQRDVVLTECGANIRGRVTNEQIATTVVEICTALGIESAAQYRDNTATLALQAGGKLAEANADVMLLTISTHVEAWTANDDLLIRGVLDWFARIPLGAASALPTLVIGIADGAPPRNSFLPWGKTPVVEKAIARLAYTGIGQLELVPLGWLTGIIRNHLQQWGREVLVEIVPDDVTERDEILAAALAWHQGQRTPPLKIVGSSLSKLIREPAFRAQFIS